MMRLVFSDLRDHAATWIGAFLVAVGCGYIGGWAASMLATAETYRNLDSMVWTMVAFSSFAAAVVLASAANLTVSAQRRSCALWQIANVGPRSVGAVVLAQLAVVATLGAACGTLVETITYAPLFPWVFSSPFYQPIDQVVLEVGVSKMPRSVACGGGRVPCRRIEGRSQRGQDASFGSPARFPAGAQGDDVAESDLVRGFGDGHLRAFRLHG